MPVPIKKSKILVAVSGGVDSVYMLHILHMLSESNHTNLGVVHFNHMVRFDSQKDVDIVKDYAQKYNIPFHYEEENVVEVARNENESVELTGRKLRRKAFAEIMDKYGYEWVALAHHADDQAETVLYNYLRGSGVHGLAGMTKYDNKQKIFRPLLDYSKKEIYSLAAEANLVWHEDLTNVETNYDRNWLRNDIIPQLEERRAGVKSVLTKSAHFFSELSYYFKTTSYKWLNDRNFEFNNIDFIMEHHFLQFEILGALWEEVHGSREGFTTARANEVIRWLESAPQGGTKVYFGEGLLTLRKNIVKWIPHDTE